VTTYTDFIHRKTQLSNASGITVDETPGFLFDFQRELVEWALNQGRSAIFADCGLGKTPMQLVWAAEIHRHTHKPVLLLTPLAVAFQTETEAAKFHIDAAISRDGTITAPITITNYDRLHYFNRDDFGGVVCDESSAIKSFDGVRRAEVTEFVRKTPYRLLCTATAAPNDYIELGTSSEALGQLGYMDMLSRFFTNKEQTSKMRVKRGQTREEAAAEGWRFKGHAEEWFWRWVASWARAMRRPSDFGYPDDGFALPDLRIVEHVIEANAPREGALFDLPAQGLREEREESRRTITERCEQAADLLAGSEPGVAWCQLNAEGDLLTRLIDGAVQVSGADPPERKEEVLGAFSRGEIRVLVTKPIIGAWGLNWQHCNQMTFFPSHSYEQFYQAVRRSWRFGQTRPVTVNVVTTGGGVNALASLQRKADQADRMFESLVAHMRDAMLIERTSRYEMKVQVPAWVKS
jgi:hypothetical protein